MTIPLGPFELDSLLARGGMGEVWRGRHRGQGVPVAVKVVTSDFAREARFYESFRHEVQAVARLDHPRIVVVFDYGTLPAEASTTSAGALVARSPYIVMELVAGGSLDDAPPVSSFRALRGLLLSLLDALAHAHARGVIHRDLKPGNVLLDPAPSGAPRIKLTDFGVAHATDRQTASRRAKETSGVTEDPSGTPYYMAPEQIYGRWRDYGPWTDLYALGILAYELACGRLPFEADTMVAIFFMHLERPLPPLCPRFPVPDGFEAWLHRLTQKAPRKRFRFAADAAWGLAQLPNVEGDETAEGSLAAGASPPLTPVALAPMAVGAGRTLTGMAPAPATGSPQLLVVPDEAAPPETRPRLELIVDDGDDGDDEGSRPAAPASPFAAEVPPQPPGWRSSADTAASMRLAGAGLGLYSLRTVPMVDRATTRDAMWEALHEVRRGAGARVVTLRGGAGHGKSRLAQWLGERAHEVGAAQVLATHHEQVPGPGHGLPRLVAAHYRVVGLPTTPLLERLEQELRLEGVDHDYEWRALAGLVSGEGPERGKAEGARPRQASLVSTTPAERNVLLTRMLHRAAADRPAIVWIDDVQWGGESLALVEHVLSEAPDLPCLFLLTARDELLEDRPAERKRLDLLAADARARTARIGALGHEDTATLIERLLGLSGDLARRVERRVEGNPLFAVQLVGDWVERGVLVAGPEGFVLRPGERGDLPDDLHAVWLGRVEQALRGRPVEMRALLELAAVLGLSVDAQEFADACAALGARFPDDLLEPLLLHRLVVPGEAGWSFAHGMLRESLERSARDEGRAAALHDACARMLGLREGQRGVAERLAHHLAEAGQREAAIEPFLVAARERLGGSQFEQAFALLDRRDRLLGELGVPESDPRALDGAVVRANVHRLHWEFDEAERCASRALDVATQAGYLRGRAEAIVMLAHCARQRGDLELAMDRNRQAFGLFERLDDMDGRARMLLAMGLVAQQEGDLDRSVEMCERARSLFAIADNALVEANCVLALGHVHRQRRSHDAARAYYESARVMFDRLGNQASVGHCVNGLAEVARYQGDLAAAEAGYREALAIQTAVGSKSAFIPRLNLGLVLTQRGEYEAARELLEAGLPVLERAGQRGFLAFLHVSLLPCAAHAADRNAWDSHYAQAHALLAETKMVDTDIAASAELAGDLQQAAGDAERARQAWAIARAQWESLGDEARVAVLDARLGEPG